MRKKIAIVLLTVIILLVIASVILSFVSGPLIKSKIIDYTKRELNINVAVKNVSLNLLGKSVSINGIDIKNPDGFSEKYIFSSDRADISFNILSIFLKKTLIVKAALINPKFYLEKNSQGNLNLKSILEDVKEKLSAPGAGESTDKQKKEKMRFFADRFLIRGGTLSFMDSTITDVPNKIELKDIFVQLKVRSIIPEHGAIPVSLEATAKLSSNIPGTIKVEGDGVISKDSQTFNLQSKANDIDIDYLRVMLGKSLRSSIEAGILDVKAPIRYKDNAIDSIITLSVDKFKLKETDESPSLLGMSVVKLLESFKDDKGIIEFDLRMKGAVNNLRFSFGPISERKLVKATVDIITDEIKSLGQKGDDEKDKAGDTVNRIRILLDLKKKDKDSQEQPQAE
jgi:hypothetical protein